MPKSFKQLLKCMGYCSHCTVKPDVIMLSLRKVNLLDEKSSRLSVTQVPAPPDAAELSLGSAQDSSLPFTR